MLLSDKADGSTLVLAACSLVCHPDTLSPSPFIIALKPNRCDIHGIVLLRADPGVDHVRALEVVDFGCAGRQTGDGNAAVLQLRV